MSTPKLICILGAESTGKTTLARQLAAQFACPWVPEYLRAFCDERGRTPQRHEQAQILETQHRHELAAIAGAAQATPFIFCDTAPITTAIYSDYVFADASLYARGRTLHARYALTLLCMPDLGWVADGHQRDGPQAQRDVHALIERELARAALPVAPIHGHGEARFNDAVAALDRLR